MIDSLSQKVLFISTEKWYRMITLIQIMQNNYPRCRDAAGVKEIDNYGLF
jgi:hypothetical protein